MDNVNDSYPTVVNSTFRANFADAWGGGVLIRNRSSLKFINCIFTDNSSYAGGGLNLHIGDAFVDNCVFISNRATEGGGIYAISGIIEDYDQNSILSGSILWNNTANLGSQIAMRDNSNLKVQYTNLQDGQVGTYCDETSRIDWGPGNIHIDPCFADPGYWEPDPCDPCELQWVEGDYHLKSEAGRWDPTSESWVYDSVTSRCIDAGNPGMPIRDEYPDPCNVRINMGAYGGTAEASRSPVGWAILTDATNDGIVDDADLLLQSQHWLETGENLSCDFNRDGVVDLVDFAMLTDEWLKMTPWYGS